METLFFVNLINYWGLVFLIFLVELVLCTFVVSPIPLSWRQFALERIAKLWLKQKRFRLVYKTIMGIILVFFLDSLRHAYLAQLFAMPTDTPTTATISEITSSLFEAERNALLCGCVLYLYMMLVRFQSMAHQIIELQERIQELQDLEERQDAVTHIPITTIPEITKVEGELRQRISVPLTEDELRQRIPIPLTTVGK